MSYGVKIFNLICPICKEAGKLNPVFLSARKNAKVCLLHREEWLRRWHRKKQLDAPARVTQSRSARARKTWYVNEHACEVTGCGYMQLTRIARVVKGKEIKEIYLCPKHLYEYRCGFIEPWTWVEKDIEAEKESQRRDLEGKVIDLTKGEQGAHTQGNAGS